MQMNKTNLNLNCFDKFGVLLSLGVTKIEWKNYEKWITFLFHSIYLFDLIINGLHKVESCDTHLINKHVHFKMDFQIQLIIGVLYYFQYLHRALSNTLWNIENTEIW